MIDLIEMFCDWRAAIERHDNGDIYESIEVNADQYDIPDQLKSILQNTADFLTEKDNDR